MQAGKIVRDLRRTSGKHQSAEDKIRIRLEAQALSAGKLAHAAPLGAEMPCAGSDRIMRSHPRALLPR